MATTQSLDVGIEHCGCVPRQAPPGSQVEFNCQVRNGDTRPDGGILCDVIWYLDGSEIARVNQFDVGPDRTRWASVTKDPGMALGEYQLTAELQNVRFKHH